MKLEFASFAFVFTLAAVINGLGIVRWLTGFSEYLRRRDALGVRHYWVFNLFAALQFLLHILLWWSLWGVRSVPEFNFLHYLYLLTGPILLFLASSLLVPDFPDEKIDIRRHYYRVRKTYATVFALVWLWAILMWPVMYGTFARTIPFLGLFLLLALVQRSFESAKAQAVVAVLNWLMIVVFIALNSMKLGGVAAELTQIP